jgi:hypothetical protein
MIKIEDQFRYKGVDFEVVTINGNFVPAREKKPSNENYPYTAHQFMRNHFQTEEAFQDAALKRFNEYEQGIRPKKVV